MTRDDRPQSGWDGVPFTKMPHELVDDPDVPDAALRLYAKLMKWVDYGGDTGGAAWTGYERMAAELGWSMEKMVRVMKRLVRAGWVHRRRRPGTSSLTFVCSHKGQRPTWAEAPNKSDSGSSDSHSARDSREVGSSDRREIGSSDNRDSVSKQEPGTENQRTPPPPPAPPADGKAPKWSEEARGVATAVWERFQAQERTPNASTWKAVAQVAQQLIDVGHQPEAITEAIMVATVCTFNAVTVTLGSRSLADGAPSSGPAPAPSPAPVVCPTCVDHVGWVEDDPDDLDSPVHPCPECRPDQFATWSIARPDHPAVQQRLPHRRDVD